MKYCNITWDKKKNKKKVYFVSTLGSIKKKDANATFILSGNGLVVVDVDTTDFNKLDPVLRELLPNEATINTKRGYHYYFTVDDSTLFTTRSKIDDEELVDLRSEGGLIFNSYWGDNKNISYFKTKEGVKKMPKKLSKYILKKLEGSKPTKRKKTKSKYNNTDKKKVKELLSYIHSYDDYDEWYQVGMALKHGMR